MNSLLIERPLEPGAAVRALLEADYVDENGLFCQCSHCRRYRCTREAERWDWIPAWVKRQPARTSHGLCRICFDYDYPKHIPRGVVRRPATYEGGMIFAVISYRVGVPSPGVRSPLIRHAG